MKFLKYILSVFAFATIFFMLTSNAAQPGIWNAGGGGYHLLFPEDSLNFKKIQMHSEKISMQLYPGFAIVKGEYQMKNETSDTVSIKVGYPVNGIYEGNHYGKLNLVTFDGLYKIKALQDDKVLNIIETPISSKQENSETFKNDNWYVWENTFLPFSTVEIEVFFMVNTNNAHIRKGYNKDNHNAFIYLLESGNVWKQPITKANFKIELKEKLTLENIHGISQNIHWKKENTNSLFASKSNFTPDQKDNIVINYGKRIEDFNFLKITDNADFYFNEVDIFSKTETPKSLTNFNSKSPYEVSESGIFQAFFVIIIISIIVLVITLVYFINRLLKTK